MEYLFLVGRILYGGYFLMNGINHLLKNEAMSQYAASKGVPLPRLAVYVSGLFILFGGLGVIVGSVYLEWSLALITIFLVLVTFKMHAYWSVEDPNMKMVEQINFWKNLGLLGAALMLFAASSSAQMIWPLPLL